MTDHISELQQKVRTLRHGKIIFDAIRVIICISAIEKTLELRERAKFFDRGNTELLKKVVNSL